MTFSDSMIFDFVRHLFESNEVFYQSKYIAFNRTLYAQFNNSYLTRN